MLGADAVSRIERMNAMIERERKEHEGKLPSCPRKSGEWGTHSNNTGLAGINQINGKFRASIFGPDYPKGKGLYLGLYENIHSAVDIICRTAKISPLDISGMTPEGWEKIKQQPIIKNKRYGVRNG